MAGPLNLEEPWHIGRAAFREDEAAAHSFIGICGAAQLACPVCGHETKRNGYEQEERVWRHGDCMFYPTYVHCRRLKAVCPNCGVKQIGAPF